MLIQLTKSMLLKTCFFLKKKVMSSAANVRVTDMGTFCGVKKKISKIINICLMQNIFCLGSLVHFLFPID